MRLKVLLLPYCSDRSFNANEIVSFCEKTSQMSLLPAALYFSNDILLREALPLRFLK